MGTTIDPIHEQAKEAYVVDADFHLDPSDPNLLLRYVDDDVVREKIRASSPPNTAAGAPPGAATWHPGYASVEGGWGLWAQGKAQTGDDVKEAMASFGIDLVLVSPGFNHLPGARYPSVKNALCSAYNDYVLDEVTTAGEDVKMQALMPQWDPVAMVEELDRIGDEKDVAGVYGWHGPYTLLGDSAYDQVFEKLVELDLPWALHGSGFFPRYTQSGDSLRSWVEALGVTWPANAMLTVANMILTGIFDKYPDLDIVIQEGGINWIPFFVYRLDEFYRDHPEDVQLAERMFDRGQQYLERAPSDYLFENFSFATQPICRPPNSRHFGALLEMCHAEETFVFSSDWPHMTVDAPNWVFESSMVDGELRDCILHENAQDVFRL